MGALSELKPHDVFNYFEQITKIPRSSYNEKAISDYIRNWALALNIEGLEVIQDEMYNLVIRKPASKGYEASQTVIIQGHLDMVAEKYTETSFDFSTQPLNIFIEGDYIKAKGTTLGADNGVAVAYAMAIIADASLAHPPLEVILTTVEEAGMDGAHALKPELITGTRLINIDSEEEGVFLSSCAGGARVTVGLDIEYTELDKKEYSSFRLYVGGLRGGHSGMDIDKEKGNSNKIIARVLNSLKTPYVLFNLTGGAKDNAIPRQSWACIYIEDQHVDAFKQEVEAINHIIKKEYEATEDNLLVELKDFMANTKNVFSEQTKQRLISLLLYIPSGVCHMSAKLAGLVETSNNLGVVRKIDTKTIFLTCAVRSSVDTRKEALIQLIKNIADTFGATFEVNSSYPGWEYSESSALRSVFVDTYKELYNKEAKVVAIHAGVECGIFMDKKEGLDAISFGPNMHDVHTPQEKLSISSTKNTYEFLLKVLKNLK